MDSYRVAKSGDLKILRGLWNRDARDDRPVSLGWAGPGRWPGRTAGRRIKLFRETPDITENRFPVPGRTTAESTPSPPGEYQNVRTTRYRPAPGDIPDRLNGSSDRHGWERSSHLALRRQASRLRGGDDTVAASRD